MVQSFPLTSIQSAENAARIELTPAPDALRPVALGCLRVEFPPASVCVFRGALDSDDFVRALAVVVSHGVNDRYITEANQRQKKAFETAQKHVRKALTALNTIRGLTRLSISGATDALERIDSKTMAYHIALRTPDRRPPAIGKRALIHAVAEVFRQFQLPVEQVDGKASKCFLEVTRCTFLALGMVVTLPAIAHQIKSAGLFAEATEQDDESQYASGRWGVVMAVAPPNGPGLKCVVRGEVQSDGTRAYYFDYSRVSTQSNECEFEWID